MLVTGKATYLKSTSGTSNRNGETRTWYRAAFLDDELESVSFYYDNPTMFNNIVSNSEVVLDLDLRTGRSGFFVNIVSVQEA